MNLLKNSKIKIMNLWSKKKLKKMKEQIKYYSINQNRQ